MSSPRPVSKEAHQLYQYMVYHRQQVWTQTWRGQHPIQVRYEADDSFLANYEPYLDELKKAKWIQRHQESHLIILGYGIVHEHLYGQDSDLDELILSLRQRYSQFEIGTIDAALVTFARQKGKESLTQLQTLNELEYYAKFPVDVVYNSLRTYLNLSPEQQHGPQYARGIMRNEKLKNGASQQQTAPVRYVTTNPERKAAADHEYKKRRAHYINEHIDLLAYDKMSPEEQTKYIANLEIEFDALQAK